MRKSCTKVERTDGGLRYAWVSRGPRVVFEGCLVERYSQNSFQVDAVAKAATFGRGATGDRAKNRRSFSSRAAGHAQPDGDEHLRKHPAIIGS